ncbi:MAG: hypothetical protein H7Z16_05365 [Pyrinomonadaceae bacterium]|nr:hypothetical protein [Pyrinomonadaceae bacterium]
MSTQTPESPAEIQVSTNPFPGLRPFDFDESHLFFGRDGQSEQLIGKLSRTHFLAVVGTSGSGKSSLVRAGFLPALQGGFMTSAGSAWRVAILRPGNDPIGNLARALNGPDVFGSELEENAAIQTAIAESTLRRGSLGLVDTARQSVMVEDENLLVVVDQFEEIFRFARVTEGEEYGNEAAAFIKLLLEASAQREVPIYVVLTMRSDYLGDCSQFWGLPEAINESQYLIPRLTRDQLREAITGPVAVGGGKISPRLVNRLLNDVGDNQDQLPVLQHLLMRSWNERTEQRLEVEIQEGEQVIKSPHREVHRGEEIDLCCAEAVGGMVNALSRHADEAYSELPDDHHREVAEKLFKALTEKGPDNREIRRPITLGEICDLTDAGKVEVITVIETFRRPGRSFLMPPVPVVLNSESLVDISHESLIRGWVRLKDWVDEEARSSRIYRRVAETAVLHKQGDAGLWGDPDLQIALTWRDQGKPNEVWARRYHPEFALAQAFLDQSVTARDAAKAAEEARSRREIKRSRLTALVFGVAFLFSLGMGVYAYGAKGKADAERVKADLAKDEALAQNAAKDRALAQAKIADEREAEARAQKELADVAREAALAGALRDKKAADEAKDDALAQTKLAESAKNEALDQKKKAEAQFILAGNALKEGEALRSLKEGDADTAITIFSGLSQIHRTMNNPSGESSALADIADIHRDRAPLLLLSEINRPGSRGPGSLGDDDVEAQMMKQYFQVLQTMESQDNNVAMEGIVNEATTAAGLYSRALKVNEGNRGKDRAAKDANLLENLGDLQIGLAEMKRSGPAAKDEAAPDEEKIAAEMMGGIKYYTDARTAYKSAKLHTDEAEVLKKIADHLSKNLSRKSTAKTDDGTPEVAQQTEPDIDSELKRVVDFYDQSSAAFRQANNTLQEATVLARIGDVYEEASKDHPERMQESIRYFERARGLFQQTKSFRKQGLIARKLAELHGALADKDKELAYSKEAVLAFIKAVLEPKRKGDSVFIAEEMGKKVTDLLYASGGKERANQFFEEAIASVGNDPVLKARTFTLIGEFYKGKGETDAAIDYLSRKREIWRQAGKFVEEGNALLEIGKIQNEAKDFVAATSSFEAARRTYRQIDPDKEGPGEKYNKASNLLIIAGLYAEYDKEKAFEIYEEQLQREVLAKSVYNIENILRLEGALLLNMKTEEATTRLRQLFQKVLDVYRREKNTEAEASVIVVMGDLYKNHGDKPEARRQYAQARSLYANNKHLSPLLELLRKLGALDVEQNPGTSQVDYFLREAEAAGQARNMVLHGAYLEVAGSSYSFSDKAKALDLYEGARVAYRGAGLESAESSVIATMSYVYSALGDKRKAEELRKLADEMAKRLAKPVVTPPR